MGKLCTRSTGISIITVRRNDKDKIIIKIPFAYAEKELKTVGVSKTKKSNEEKQRQITNAALNNLFVPSFTTLNKITNWTNKYKLPTGQLLILLLVSIRDIMSDMIEATHSRISNLETLFGQFRE